MYDSCGFLERASYRVQLTSFPSATYGTTSIPDQPFGIRVNQYQSTAIEFRIEPLKNDCVDPLVSETVTANHKLIHLVESFLELIVQVTEDPLTVLREFIERADQHFGSASYRVTQRTILRLKTLLILAVGRNANPT